METALNNKVALVTGASAGIGRAIALKLSSLGCKLVLCGRHRERLRRLKKQIGGDAIWIKADLTCSDEITMPVTKAMETFGKIDILVENAGCFSNLPFVDESAETTQRMIDVNFSAAVQLAKLVLPDMQARQSGEILAIGSIAGIADMRDEAVYSATKHALRAFMKSLRRQVVKDGIRVSSILPGTVATEIWGMREESAIDDMVERHEMLRAEDIADISAFMLLQPPHITIRELVVLPQAQDI